MGALAVEAVRTEPAAVRWQSVDAASRAVDHVGLPADPVEELLPLLAGPSADEQVELWLGWHDGLVVGASSLRLPLLDNTSAATLDVRVHPDHRRRGHGTALLRQLLARADRHGRSKLFAEAAEPLHGAGPAPGPAFVRTAGGRPVLTEIRRLLDLTTAQPSRLAELRGTATAAAAGYSLLQWVDRAPAEAYDDLATLAGRMTTDTPLEEMDWQPEVWTAQRYRDTEDQAIARRRRRVGTAVRHDASGRLVGYTDIGVSVGHPEVAYQWDTIVAPEHRGHRLGLLIKVANLALLQATVPQVRLLNTWNAEVNAHMVAINDALGFQPVERWREWQLDPTPPARG